MSLRVEEKMKRLADRVRGLIGSLESSVPDLAPNKSGLHDRQRDFEIYRVRVRGRFRIMAALVPGFQWRERGEAFDEVVPRGDGRVRFSSRLSIAGAERRGARVGGAPER